MSHLLLLKDQQVTVDAVALTLLLNLAKDRKLLLHRTQLRALEEPLEALWKELVTDLVGAIVTPVTGTNYLRSGSAAHDCAVVISKDPFIISTADGEHKWEQQDSDKFVIIGKVTPERLAALQQKWLLKP